VLIRLCFEEPEPRAAGQSALGGSNRPNGRNVYATLGSTPRGTPIRETMTQAENEEYFTWYGRNEIRDRRPFASGQSGPCGSRLAGWTRCWAKIRLGPHEWPQRRNPTDPWLPLFQG
jgi:hypothetical protein